MPEEPLYKRHRLKLWREYYLDIDQGVRRFDVRLNDRDFQVGDVVLFEEYDRAQKQCTGRSVERTITVVHGGIGLLAGYVVLQLI